MDISPFKRDIDELIDEFSKCNSTTLADMKRIWLARKFTFIYEARPTKNEGFFMQSLFAISLGHMLAADSLSQSLGGFYCLYCLYKTQPFKPPYKIYLSLGELKKLKSLVVEAKKANILVMPAIVNKMLEKNVFLFGSVEINDRSVTERVAQIDRSQNAHMKVAYDKLLAKTPIKKVLHMDLGKEIDLKAMKKTTAEYEAAKGLAIRDILEIPASTRSKVPWNNHLKKVEKLGERLVAQPEDICFDKDGTLYTATRDGWIKKMYRNGSWEDWKMAGGNTLLGIAMSSKSDHLLVCDANKGLLQVNEEGASVLASHVNGSKIRFADEVIEASNGNIYFSDFSSKYWLHNWYLDMLEAKPHGRLLMYNPSTKETSALLENMCSPNGVALSKDQDFLVVCESWKFRCLKYWLKGDMTGKSEIFIDNLPGGPDNVNLAPDGSFWIALVQWTTPGLEFVHKSKAIKRLVAMFPKLMDQIMKGVYKKAMVVNVNMDGKIIYKFDDFDGNVMSFVTSAVEFKGHIYLGSLNTNFIGKLQLTPSILEE